MLSRLPLLLALTLAFAGCTTVPEIGGFFDRRDTDSRRIVIDLGAQRAFLYDRGQLIAESRISSGREGKNTPVGRFKVIQKSARHRSSLYGDYVRNGRVVKANVDNRRTPRPPGAQFVGAPMPYFLRFNGAYGLHAGYIPGYPASNGCVRLPLSQARRFYRNVRLGTPVIVQR